jgi:vancomycin resistance protein YoaR
MRMSQYTRGRSNARSFGEQRSNGASKSPSGGSRRPRVGVLLLSLAVLIGIGVGVVYLINKSGGVIVDPGSSQTPGALDSDKFYDGVFVDGISLGGLTRGEAKQQVEAGQKEAAKTIGVTAVNGTQSWKFMLSDLPASALTYDTEIVLDQAWKQGREGTDAQNRETILKLPANPVKFSTTVKADPSSLEQRVRDLTAVFFKAATDAAYAGYDATKPAGVDRLSFTADIPGQQVNADLLWAAVKKDFEDGTFGTVQIAMEPLPAAVTLAGIQASMQLIGSFETEIRNSAAPRRANITLGNSMGNTSINGVGWKFVLPGETFSLNDSTGPRTEAKGYQKAPIDNNGIDDVGVGGGMCQVSGTLYNAAIAAGPNTIEIVERNHHSIPSYYMQKGYDATVDYGSKDLKFKNISSKPILIILYYDYDKTRKYDYHEHAEIYGLPDPEGAKYSLDCKVIKTIDPLPGQRTAPNSALQPGETKVYPAHPGYIVARYLRKVAASGVVTETRLTPDDKYSPDMEVIAYFKDDVPPTPTPTPSPTPSDTIAPTPEPTPTPTEEPTPPPP